ncbi:MAG: hypothetical protein HRU00_09565 [Myxococcales bacterium]|nr:hypothetical protein [Myxococcales bacterium]
MSTTPVGDIVTDRDLELEIGEGAFKRLAPDTSDGESARQRTFDDLLDQLANRTPPIHEQNLVDLSELKVTIVYGACARLYRSNISTGSMDDLNAAQHKIYHKQYEQRADRLRPTVTGGLKAAGGFSIKTSRR